MKNKKVAILGSTGSIGKNSIAVCENNGFEVTALSTNTNIKLLEEQLRKSGAKRAAVANEGLYKEFKNNIKDLDVKIYAGTDGIAELSGNSGSDILLNSVVGIAGLLPTLEGIKSGCDIALANKETLVVGGSLVMKAAKGKKVRILPVDSEHSAIFQCLKSGRKSEIKKLILTASGGPFFGKTQKELENISVSNALKHPKWSMGAKISIDSATLMNKGLEVIEAYWLFGVKNENIEVVVHPESIIHSLVEFKDSSVIAQLGAQDMKLPIQYALTYPQRCESGVESISLKELKTLSFFEPDMETFVCLKAAYEALKSGKTAPAALNGANEEANRMFLDGEIGFNDIGSLVYKALKNHKIVEIATVEDILKADKAAREFVTEDAKSSERVVI